MRVMCNYCGMMLMSLLVVVIGDINSGGGGDR